MKRIVWIPVDMDKPVKVIDLDEPKWKSLLDEEAQSNPYEIGYELHRQLPDSPSVNTVWQEKVNTCISYIKLYVDEEGHLKHLPRNNRASMWFYPHAPGIAGDCFVAHVEKVFNEEGPDLNVVDISSVVLVALADLIGS